MKKNFIIFLILISLLIIPIVLSASLFVDRSSPNYNLLETVRITGTSFTPNEDVGIEIRDSTNALVFINQTKVNATGGFSNNYIIPESGRTGTYAVYASTRFESASNTFTVLADTQSPQWSNIKQSSIIVTLLDNVQINITWYDNINLNKVLIWENSTGIWVSH